MFLFTCLRALHVGARSAYEVAGTGVSKNALCILDAGNAGTRNLSRGLLEPEAARPDGLAMPRHL